jgi:hypothetical protein
MVPNIIPFPAHRTTRVFTDVLPEDATAKEEAIFHVRRARAQRDASDPATRRHHAAAIMLDWWERELARLVGEAA